MLFPELKFRGLRYSVDDRVKKKKKKGRTQEDGMDAACAIFRFDALDLFPS